ncbi:MAG: hypothetical protein NUV49_02485 [Patescibacteria group bacterium]|nr:hypothetical protein [Patescibacteria group bacterium]
METGRGLTGDSGLFPGGHISMNYSNNGMVFVDHEGHWKRVPVEDADPEKIVRCCVRRCNEPAVTLSHCYPYIWDGTYCEKHEKKRG